MCVHHLTAYLLQGLSVRVKTQKHTERPAKYVEKAGPENAKNNEKNNNQLNSASESHSCDVEGEG